jgi:hypothetical protein
MTPSELARRNVDAAVRRFGDSRLVITIDAASEWAEAIVTAAEKIRSEWKPNGEELYSRLEHRLEEYHGPAGEEPVSMDIVIWHMEHMLQEAFVVEMKRHHVSEADAARARHRMTLEKWKG